MGVAGLSGPAGVGGGASRRVRSQPHRLERSGTTDSPAACVLLCAGRCAHARTYPHTKAHTRHAQINIDIIHDAPINL